MALNLRTCGWFFSIGTRGKNPDKDGQNAIKVRLREESAPAMRRGLRDVDRSYRALEMSFIPPNGSESPASHRTLELADGLSTSGLEAHRGEWEKRRENLKRNMSGREEVLKREWIYSCVMHTYDMRGSSAEPSARENPAKARLTKTTYITRLPKTRCMGPRKSPLCGRDLTPMSVNFSQSSAGRIGTSPNKYERVEPRGGAVLLLLLLLSPLGLPGVRPPKHTHLTASTPAHRRHPTPADRGPRGRHPAPTIATDRRTPKRDAYVGEVGDRAPLKLELEG
ncbi:hypothetical protein C8R44DRAFT_749130 [Mycena epipterygia]|nr:hypothetical protein C8R44DRAFT_749130 [Mycena epipterygia]